MFSAELVGIVTETGVCLDPVYTLKGVRGMLAEMATNPARFQGKRVLFIHTGKSSSESVQVSVGFDVITTSISMPTNITACRMHIDCHISTHTGGVFGLYDGRIDELLKRTPVTNCVQSHEQAIPNPSPNS